MWHRLVWYRSTVVSEVPAACMLANYSENWSSRLLRNFGSSNSSGDLKVPGQQKICVLFSMDWFSSRCTALLRLQILCSFGWKLDDCVDWWRGNIWKEGTHLFHSPTKNGTCVLQNIIPLRPDRLVSQKLWMPYFVCCVHSTPEDWLKPNCFQ
jgi:hypothetical protein